MLKKKSIVKNYIILIVLFILSFAFTLYLCKWYNVYKEYKNEIPVIRGVLSEISYDELDHYIIDNSNIMLYICTSNSDNCRGFEKKLKKYVNRKELSDKIAGRYPIYITLHGGGGGPEEMNNDQWIDMFHYYRIILKKH